MVTKLTKTKNHLISAHRYYPQSSFVSYDGHSEWLVAGSNDATSHIMEYFVNEGEQGTFYLSGTTLPEEMYHHCQVKKNSTSLSNALK